MTLAPKHSMTANAAVESRVALDQPEQLLARLGSKDLSC